MHATPEAQSIRGKPDQPVKNVKTPEECEAEARAHVVSEGGNPDSGMLVLSRYERDRSVSTSPLMVHKDALARYANAYPAVKEEVRFRRAFVDSRVQASQPGQEGQALVGFHRYRGETLQELYESKDKDHIGNVNWLRKQTPRNPGDPMEAALKYIGRRDQEAAAPPSPLAGVTTASGPLGAAVSAFLGQRSVTPGQLQATVRKILTKKPAVPRVPASRPAVRPDLRPVEPSDAELVAVAIATETSLDTQVPVVTQTTTDPPQASQDPPGAAVRTEEQAVPRQSFPRPPPASPELLLPKSWRAALNKEQQQWIGRTLFTRGCTGRSQLTTELRLWWYPPQPRLIYSQPPASPDPFFACPLFLWMPLRMWSFKLTCTQPGCNTTLTKAGLYKTIRRVLDVKGWYLMATEYLECPKCKKKVAGWSQDVLGQLDPAHRVQFPAILTYKLPCDIAVVVMLRERSLGNSATQLYKKLCESHSEAWMRRSIQYLGECQHFMTFGNIRPQFPPLPEMPKVPSPVWLLTVYSMDVLSRLDELKARVTSVFGSILKMDSTKKVTKKLAGAASDTAAWATDVGNEYGQVLNCVLTAGEGEGLLRMAAGLTERYRLAGVPPPELMYVDRDCCSSVGGSKTAAMFPEFAAGVVSESHQLYGAFMRQLSSSIFEWDAGDVRRLLEAKRSELEGRRGMVGLTDREVYSHLRRKEMALHCRRRTRGAAETELLLMEMLEIWGTTPWASRCWMPFASGQSGKSRGVTSNVYRTL
ncbi:unnamed protein product [Leuciscus chuanchicus]